MLEAEEKEKWLYVPTTIHIVLAAITIVLCLPFPIFAYFNYVTALAGGIIAFDAFLGGAMAIMTVSIMYTRRGPTFGILVGQDKGLVGIAAAAFVGTAAAIVNLCLEFIGCGSRNTSLSLMEFTFNETCAEANVTLTVGSAPLYRRPFFAFQYGWYQGCLDDMPILIAFLVLFAALAVTNIITIVHYARVNRRSQAHI